VAIGDRFDIHGSIISLASPKASKIHPITWLQFKTNKTN
jgi:hypothetical protein